MEDKWNWNKIIDLSVENNILDKSFSENITMRPLEIRAFKLTKPRFLENCRNPSTLKYNSFAVNHFLNRYKDFVKVDKNPTNEAAIDYLLNQNHCDSINKPETQWAPLSTKPSVTPSQNTHGEQKKPIVKPTITPTPIKPVHP